MIDDDPLVRTAIERVLGREHELAFLSNGRAALELVAEDDRWDLILCDLMMPVMNGAQLYRALCERHPRLASRVVFLTGGACTAECRRLLDEVDNRVLNKPFRVGQLRLLVAEALSVSAA